MYIYSIHNLVFSFMNRKDLYILNNISKYYQPAYILGNLCGNENHPLSP